MFGFIESWWGGVKWLWENGQNIRGAIMSLAFFGKAHELLQLFIIEVVAPACWSQIQLQTAILRHLCNNEKFLYFAEQGLRNDYYGNSEFSEAFKTVARLGGSPIPPIIVGQMIKCITELENEHYKNFWRQSYELAYLAGVDCERDPVLGPLWEKWHVDHNTLVSKYNDLKRVQRYGPPLYRPQKESRWGGIIESPLN